jgi:hypothetical protein
MSDETKWFNQPTKEELQERNSRLKGWLAGAIVAAAAGWLAFGLVVVRF